MCITLLKVIFICHVGLLDLKLSCYGKHLLHRQFHILTMHLSISAQAMEIHRITKHNNIFHCVFVNMYFQKLHFRFILFNNIESPYIVLIIWIFLMLDMTNDYVALTCLIIEAQASLIPEMELFSIWLV